MIPQILTPKIPQTTTDKVIFLFALTAASFLWGIIIMGYQGRQPPSEFKDIGLLLSGGVLGAVTGKNLY